MDEYKNTVSVKIDDCLRYKIITLFHKGSVLEVINIPDGVTTSTIQKYLDDHVRQRGLFSLEMPRVEFSFLENNYGEN